MIRTPGMEVGIDENGPRISLGASGLGSQVSSWLGPPDSQIRMTDFLAAPVRAVGELSFARAPVAEASPAPSPASPACNTHRRDFSPNAGVNAPPNREETDNGGLWGEMGKLLQKTHQDSSIYRRDHGEKLQEKLGKSLAFASIRVSGGAVESPIR